MTHLGERVSPLVDGRLAPDAAERALAHAATCPACREALDAERAVRARLVAAVDPAPSAELIGLLLAMGGPQGPLTPRSGHVPGDPRPVPLPPPGRLPSGAGAPWELSRPDGRRDGVRPGDRRGRGRRSRVAVAAVGAFSLASAGVLGLVALGGTVDGAQPVVPAVDRFVIEHGGVARQLPFADPAAGLDQVSGQPQAPAARRGGAP